MIDQLTIEKILDAANIVDVVSEFVTLRRRGVVFPCIKVIDGFVACTISTIFS